MRKRFVVALATVFACALALAGCGGAAANSLTGRYEGYAASIFGTNSPIEETYDEGENYVELNDDDTAVICLDGSPIDGTYKVDGEDITITINEGDESYDSVGTVKDGVLTFDFLGLGLELTFVKDGAEKPFEVSATTTGDDSATEDTTETTDETTTDDGTAEEGDATDASSETGEDTASSGEDAQASE